MITLDWSPIATRRLAAAARRGAERPAAGLELWRGAAPERCARCSARSCASPSGEALGCLQVADRRRARPDRRGLPAARPGLASDPTAGAGAYRRCPRRHPAPARPPHAGLGAGGAAPPCAPADHHRLRHRMARPRPGCSRPCGRARPRLARASPARRSRRPRPCASSPAPRRSTGSWTATRPIAARSAIVGRPGSFLGQLALAAREARELVLLLAFERAEPVAGHHDPAPWRQRHLRGRPCRRRAAASCAPTHLLLWHAIEALIRKQVRWLDLGGIATDRSPGIARFKLGMGGTVATLPGTFLIGGGMRVEPVAATQLSTGVSSAATGHAWPASVAGCAGASPDAGQSRVTLRPHCWNSRWMYSHSIRSSPSGRSGTGGCSGAVPASASMSSSATAGLAR